jgi:hypothetical protein
MALKDSGGSGLGSSRGTGAARSAASVGGFNPSGGMGPRGAYEVPHLEGAYQRGLSDGRAGRPANPPTTTSNPKNSNWNEQTNLRDWYEVGHAEGAKAARGRLKSSLDNLVKRKK